MGAAWLPSQEVNFCKDVHLASIIPAFYRLYHFRVFYKIAPFDCFSLRLKQPNPRNSFQQFPCIIYKFNFPVLKVPKICEVSGLLHKEWHHVQPLSSHTLTRQILWDCFMGIECICEVWPLFLHGGFLRLRTELFSYMTQEWSRLHRKFV